jgi:hypothetical protein
LGKRKRFFPLRKLDVRFDGNSFAVFFDELTHEKCRLRSTLDAKKLSSTSKWTKNIVFLVFLGFFARIANVILDLRDQKDYQKNFFKNNVKSCLCVEMLY